ncbi:MAG: fumarylacetoacetate hydrolase family protein [Rhodospirillales bacterium]|jgi:2-keto-4-pentenoate hydratase/2-oxohepta-3-ene-1,7-dioic acid hydratase in catechol pathway|nr:fumarylacetoacetate hydrolase family protein [Rhodospirillales bacterium]
MKLLRYGPKGAEKPGLLDEGGRVRDLSDHVADIDGSVLAPERLAALGKLDAATLPLIEGSPRLGPPVAGVGKIIAIGLNYSVHVKESGMEMPKEPVMFTKAVTAINGPNDPVIMPRGSTKTDWEVELAVVIGRKAQYVEEDQALDYVAGYAVMNDISERAFQMERGGQWVKGKSFDTSAPFGPWLVTRDEIPNPQKLNLWLEVNGVRHQDDNTETMIFGVAHLISYVSCFMTLLPGDIITTGTPPGVGLGMKPPVYLAAGDVMRLGVEGLGEQRQEVRAWKPA